ncbi:hypothetical protein GCM10025857_30070 [Alicyclobacillus contaminans]|nr:hypothetical protein GCM10025857_30070 [Alicyclobacillus contaminans]
MYTVWLRGLVNGQPVDERQIVTSISRGINPHTDWDAVLACAENPDIRIVLSNTTESGVRYQPEPRPLDQAPLSFPGKLTAYLYHRFAHFQGHPDAGMVVVPCELVDDNGAKVRELVLRYAADWQLPESFAEWVTAHNRFCNTLVDRIVTGFPQGTCAEDWEDVLGYADELLTVGEPFHLWVIENAGPLAQWWPFDRIGLNVHYVADAAPTANRRCGFSTAVTQPWQGWDCWRACERCAKSWNTRCSVRLFGDFWTTRCCRSSHRRPGRGERSSRIRGRRAGALPKSFR